VPAVKKEEPGTIIVDRKLNMRRHPLISCGRACTGHSWIGAIFIAGRHRSGESIASLMYDYNLTRKEVKNAIAYIAKRSKK
jgi:uncharacterized protein (DUF433 family)